MTTLTAQTATAADAPTLQVVPSADALIDELGRELSVTTTTAAPWFLGVEGAALEELRAQRWEQQRWEDWTLD